MSASNLNSSPTAEWTVFGTYREDNEGTGGIHEERFAGTFAVESAEAAAAEAEVYMGHEFNGGLEIHKVVPGPVEGVQRLMTDEELYERMYGPDSTP